MPASIASLPHPWNARAILLVLAAFVAIGLVHPIENGGDDLSSSYVGCHLVATGQADHLYSFDPVNFPDVGDDAWDAAAEQGHFDGSLHPYVQTPLWAFALQPLCTRTTFATFNTIFQTLALLGFAAAVWLVARFWATSLFNPYAIALILVALWVSQPFQYAMYLTQTHILFFLATVAALILAERGHPLAAGLLLASAAAVKITPAFLLFYWLLTRRYQAAASMAAVSALLWIATLLTTGPALAAVYLADLNRIARVLLVSINNQSFAAWAMARFYPAEIPAYHILPLPTAVRLVSTALLLAATLAGGLLDRSRKIGPPLGALIALVAATLFAPIAWSHYFVILLAPLMVLIHLSRTLPRPARYTLRALILAIAALNYPPLAPDVIARQLGHLALARAQFYAGLLCLAALTLTALTQRQSTKLSS